MLCSQASRESCNSLSSLVLKGVVSPKASSSSSSRAYTISLVKARHLAIYSPLGRQSTTTRACRFVTFRGFCPCFLRIQSISSIVTDLTQQLIPLMLVQNVVALIKQIELLLQASVPKALISNSSFCCQYLALYIQRSLVSSRRVFSAFSKCFLLVLFKTLVEIAPYHFLCFWLPSIRSRS